MCMQILKKIYLLKLRELITCKVPKTVKIKMNRLSLYMYCYLPAFCVLLITALYAACLALIKESPVSLEYVDEAVY